MKRLINSVFCTALFAVSLSVSQSSLAEEITKTRAMTEFGEPLYKDNFEHWPYVNPDAPKGGTVVLGAFGSFDSLNTYILKGNYPRSLGLTGDTLMTGSADELDSAYGLIAETAEFPEDKSWVIFNLRPEAKFSDGTPITAADFEFALATIREHGRPFLKSFYEEIENIEVLGDHRLKFNLTTTDSMKPIMTAAGMGPLPSAYWKERDISKTYLDPAPASGAYVVDSLEAGRSITYKRNENYWGKDLAVNRGLNNYDEIRYDYYRDLEVMVEAFKSGAIDYRSENSSKRWATAYKIDDVENGNIVLATPPDNQPQGIQAFMMNSRRAPFDDQRVRRAFNFLYDFEATRRTILYDQYERINSFFPNSEYGATGKPTAEEVAVLEPFRDQLPAEIFTEEFLSPVTDGSGKNRRQVREAIKLFKEAGWNLSEGKLMKDGKQMKVEMLLGSAGSQRVHALFIQAMKKVGIDAEFRVVDSAQYEVRTEAFDFDIVSVKFNFFPPPGAELRSFYGSEAADERGTGNYVGIKNAVVDELIEQVIASPSLEELKVVTRALDRVLLWSDHVVPQFYNAIFRLAYWNRFGQPETKPKYGTGFLNSWWVDESLDGKLDLDR